MFWSPVAENPQEKNFNKAITALGGKPIKKKKNEKTNIDDIIAFIQKQIIIVNSILQHAFDSPGPLYNPVRHKIQSMWLGNFIKNLEDTVKAIETGKDIGGNQISFNQVMDGLKRMCSEYGKYDMLKRHGDVCGMKIRRDFETVLEEIMTSLSDTH